MSEMTQTPKDNVTRRNDISVAALNLYTCEIRLSASEPGETRDYHQRRYEDAKARMRELLNDGT